MLEQPAFMFMSWSTNSRLSPRLRVMEMLVTLTSLFSHVGGRCPRLG
ncbi:hypothetical protein I314_00647 [Cryptococcus bacillisporus CA1873]|uniref:Unplaced genomic scaffold supercont1.6, whole genome shotgun sequence n=2 Tax=Cryptococcus gattii TaxID=552467 RepID=A0A0D0VP44_CRYGA|nr:hypothetical protein I312_02605 [Cryptococcus bacillisporus CA1280]KIR69535.1 hypothetical protein I314_00647 [Cryptococcus bacillisporus CA1873]|eukprot:KIR69535.1 hypothetical protein I314_00647 [Cryptococcus gattii CA1873]